MSTTSVTFRVDSAVKKRADCAFKNKGLTMTAALNEYLRAIAGESGISVSHEFVTDGSEKAQDAKSRAFEDFRGFAGTLKRDADIKKESAEWRSRKYE
jgi:addiction module RelB/DinJ family antitoxin